MVKCAFVIIKGKVQGVCFRAFAKQNANKLGIFGYAKNLRDGSLEILAQGEDLKLKKFLDTVRAGPLMAKISSFDVSFRAPEPNLEFFDIR